MERNEIVSAADSPLADIPVRLARFFRRNPNAPLLVAFAVGVFVGALLRD